MISLEYISKLSLIKTIYCSLRLKGIVLVGRKTNVILKRGARLKTNRKSVLAIGLSGDLPTGSLLHMSEDSEIELSGRAHVSRGSRVTVSKNAHLLMGDQVFINESCVLDCSVRISIGSWTAVGWGSNIVDSDLHAITYDGIRQKMGAEITIGKHVWLGLGTTVLKGVKIGDDSVVAARALVTSDVAPGVLVGGVPAKVLRTGVNWAD